jgi:hypothetical protein
VDIYNASDTAKATFDASDDLLSMLNSSGQVLARVPLAGDVSGLHVNKLSTPNFNFIAINDGGNAGIGAGGNIPVTIVS